MGVTSPNNSVRACVCTNLSVCFWDRKHIAVPALLCDQCKLHLQYSLLAPAGSGQHTHTYTHDRTHTHAYTHHCFASAFHTLALCPSCLFNLACVSGETWSSHQLVPHSLIPPSPPLFSSSSLSLCVLVLFLRSCLIVAVYSLQLSVPPHVPSWICLRFFFMTRSAPSPPSTNLISCVFLFISCPYMLYLLLSITFSPLISSPVFCVFSLCF